MGVEVERLGQAGSDMKSIQKGTKYVIEIGEIVLVLYLPLSLYELTPVCNRSLRIFAPRWSAHIDICFYIPRRIPRHTSIVTEDAKNIVWFGPARATIIESGENFPPVGSSAVAIPATWVNPSSNLEVEEVNFNFF